ncbi:hypothetical protein Ga0123462_0889 [Mariprofundus ferrinatatus]|uniref:Uncharacterized protein n=1 Tax=Mariprofundus ferrinatatus TaxID=1921087 RepID=A0A2K8L349_9PROT|nr:hypothetical protein [Mariprofundus ferrinatatus]ATX81758.1 hypothetical protein Ga0123462_0889 [Mariprofundus ferrinatatus]
MKSTVIATIEFSFKGETVTPSTRVDLDPVMRNHNHLEVIYDKIAASIGLDSYSYQYDVLTMEEIVFSDPEGPVSAFVHNGKLDIDGFRDVWLEENITDAVRPIAKKYLKIDNLNEHIELKHALIESYRAGQLNPESKVEDDRFL